MPSSIFETEKAGVDPLYKYMSLQKFDRLLDVIYNQRLYMAKHDSLNDPYEGNLVATDVSHLQGENQDPIAFAAMLEAHDKRWQQSLSRYRICSLSNTWKSTLLWAHYADEFRGICIELSTADDSDIYPVKYESMNNIAQVLKCNDTPLTGC
jgi:hypothetical protein